MEEKGKTRSKQTGGWRQVLGPTGGQGCGLGPTRAVVSNWSSNQVCSCLVGWLVGWSKSGVFLLGWLIHIRCVLAWLEWKPAATWPFTGSVWHHCTRGWERGLGPTRGQERTWRRSGGRRRRRRRSGGLWQRRRRRLDPVGGRRRRRMCGLELAGGRRRRCRCGLEPPGGWQLRRRRGPRPTGGRWRRHRLGPTSDQTTGWETLQGLGHQQSFARSWWPVSQWRFSGNKRPRLGPRPRSRHWTWCETRPGLRPRCRNSTRLGLRLRSKH